MRYVICYDISDDNRRNGLAKFLLNYGQRVQYSVFEFNLPEKKLIDTVLKGIVEYIASKEDSIRVYRLCSECAGLIQTYGSQRVNEPSSVAVVV